MTLHQLEVILSSDSSTAYYFLDVHEFMVHSFLNFLRFMSVITQAFKKFNQNSEEKEKKIN